MKLFTEQQWQKLKANGLEANKNPEFDPLPVVKLFTPDASCTWLLAWVEPEDEDIAFGLCDLGLGFPECGSVRLSELRELRGKLGLPVERDLHWSADKSVSAYADEAARAGGVR